MHALRLGAGVCLAVLVIGLAGCSSDGPTSSNGHQDDFSITEVRVGPFEGAFVSAGFPRGGTGPAPRDLGGYYLSGQDLIMLNVEVVPRVEELLVGAPGGHFILDMSGDHGGVSDTSRIYTIMIKVEGADSEVTIPVAVRDDGLLSRSTDYTLQPVDRGLDPCMVPVAVANATLAGTWIKLCGSSGEFFPYDLEFRKTYFGGGMWIGDGRMLNYAIAVEPDGCEAEPNILLTDSAYNLVLTYGYHIQGSSLRLSNWTRAASYLRTSAPPIEPPPPDKVYVPYLRGLKRESALTSLSLVGLTPGALTTEQTGSLPDDSVIRQNPPGG